MGNTDSVPIVSQFKSLGQAIVGNTEGALETQQNFAFNNTFPGVSQVQTLSYLMKGQVQQGIDLQVKFHEDMESVISGIPVVGHAKGAIMYSLGDKEEGMRTIKTATRNAAVAAGGIAGMATLGPLGAIAGGAAGGLVADGAITAFNVLEKGAEGEASGVINHALGNQEDAIPNVLLTHLKDGMDGLLSTNSRIPIKLPIRNTVSIISRIANAGHGSNT